MPKTNVRGVEEAPAIVGLGYGSGTECGLTASAELATGKLAFSQPGLAVPRCALPCTWAQQLLWTSRKTCLQNLPPKQASERAPGSSTPQCARREAGVATPLAP
eukprot:12504652-Heterocapsa_arctica.AAC.1